MKGKDFRFVDYLTINAYWFALAFTANSLHPIILPAMVEELVPKALKATCLGLLIFAGLVVAIVVQPIMGAISDRSTSRFGRRRPFILSGTLLDLVFLTAIAFAKDYSTLFLALLSLQFSSNIAHGAYQGLIPDIFPQDKRGTASGAKSLMEISGAIGAFLVTGHLVERGGNSLAIGFVMAVLLLSMLVTVLAVREEPLVKLQEKPVFEIIISTFKIDFRKRGFVWWLTNRFLFFMGLSSIQTFLFYFIKDVAGLPNPAEAVGGLGAMIGIAVLLISLPIGYLADRVGRKPILVISGLGAFLGIILLPFARSYLELLACGGFLGLSAGAFVTVGWALATDIVPKEEAGRYLGVTNLATAGGSAIARLGGTLVDFFNTLSAGMGYTVIFILDGLCFVLATLSILKVRET